MINEIINSCVSVTGGSTELLANYAHIIPVVLSLILGIFIFIKAKYNFFSKVFLAFVIAFSIWLLGDWITWTNNNYYFIYAIWAPLLYIEIIFYILGLYFALVFVKKADISIYWKIILFILTLPAFIFTITQKSVTGFDHSVCEAFNNNFLDIYKLSVEGIVLFIILIYAITPLFKKFSWKEARPNLIVLGSMFVFLSIFGATEYWASITGNYELNLYSLFLLPVLLVAIIYSVFELDIFNVNVLGTHYLVVGLLVLMGGQLFFVTNNTNRFLTILTMVLIAILGIVLFRNLKRESDQRVKIVKLNTDLQKLIEQRESLVHLVTHKVKGSFTRSKYIFAGLLDGTFGDISKDVKKYAQQGLESDNLGIATVDLVLNADNLQRGVIRYNLQNVNFKDIVLKIIEEKKVPAEARGLVIKTEVKQEKENNYTVLADGVWLKEAINNLVENSIRYTKKGEIQVSLENVAGKIKFNIKDTGIGITEEDKKNLFIQGGRGRDSVKVNVDSTGYGLYSAKLIIEAHKGTVWAESEGADKGATFFVELPAVELNV